jgi:hypothetical protein
LPAVVVGALASPRKVRVELALQEVSRPVLRMSCLGQGFEPWVRANPHLRVSTLRARARKLRPPAQPTCVDDRIRPIS